MLALALSGGKDSMACYYLARPILDCAIYVNTGFAFPETREMVERVSKDLPVYTVHTDRKTQNAVNGIPADIVPVNWTSTGQVVTGKKPTIIQNYLQCCFENISYPLFLKAKELGVTELVCGQRQSDLHKSTLGNGESMEGITRIYPIEHWTDGDIFAFLGLHMTIPDYYRIIKHTSLDCYDCTAYHNETRDLRAWTKEQHPDFYSAYMVRRIAVVTALVDAVKDSA